MHKKKEPITITTPIASSNHQPGTCHEMPDGTRYIVMTNGACKRMTPRKVGTNLLNNSVMRCMKVSK